MWPPRKGTEFTIIQPIYNEFGDMEPRLEDIVAKFSKDGEPDYLSTNPITEISEGIYKIQLTSHEMDADIVSVTFESSKEDVRLAVGMVYTIEEPMRISLPVREKKYPSLLVICGHCGVGYKSQIGWCPACGAPLNRSLKWLGPSD